VDVRTPAGGRQVVYQVKHEGAYVGAFGAGHPELHRLGVFRVPQKGEAGDSDCPGGSFHVLPPPSSLVQPLTPHLLKD